MLVAPRHHKRSAPTPPGNVFSASGTTGPTGPTEPTEPTGRGNATEMRAAAAARPRSGARAHLVRPGRAAAHERCADDGGCEERQADSRQSADIGRALVDRVAVHHVADALLHELDVCDLAKIASRHLSGCS